MEPPGRRPVGQGGADIQVRAWAPGRVNLIGDHTDYCGGLVLPMALEQGTTIEFRRQGQRVELVSTHQRSAVVLPVGRAPSGPTSAPPVSAPPTSGWGRYVAGVTAELGPVTGGMGVVHSDLPVGAGLSSSSSLTVAVALALGFVGTELDLARLCQRAESAGSGVPGGIMDQLCSAAGRAHSALLIDCHDLSIQPVSLPPDAEIIIAHSGQSRTLVGSAYAQRRAECEAAEALIGPLRLASLAAVETLADPILRRRARHVVTENDRVRRFARALAGGDLSAAGRAMDESHVSLRDDFEVSSPALDQLVAKLRGRSGVHGARLTGAGFGGCVVALARTGTWADIDPQSLPGPAWPGVAADGARVEVIG